MSVLTPMGLARVTNSCLRLTLRSSHSLLFGGTMCVGLTLKESIIGIHPTKDLF